MSCNIIYKYDDTFNAANFLSMKVMWKGCDVSFSWSVSSRFTECKLRSVNFLFRGFLYHQFVLITSINIEWGFNYSQNSRIKSIDNTRGPWVLPVTRVFSHPLSIFTFISRADGLWTKSAPIILIIVCLFRCRLFSHEKQTESLSGKKKQNKTKNPSIN